MKVIHSLLVLMALVILLEGEGEEGKEETFPREELER